MSKRDEEAFDEETFEFGVDLLSCEKVSVAWGGGVPGDAVRSAIASAIASAARAASAPGEMERLAMERAAFVAFGVGAGVLIAARIFARRRIGFIYSGVHIYFWFGWPFGR